MCRHPGLPALFVMGVACVVYYGAFLGHCLLWGLPGSFVYYGDFLHHCLFMGVAFFLPSGLGAFDEKPLNIDAWVYL